MAQTPRWPDVFDMADTFGSPGTHGRFITGDTYGRWVFSVWVRGDDPSTWAFPNEPRYTVERVGWTDLDHALDQFDEGGELILETDSLREVAALFTY